MLISSFSFRVNVGNHCTTLRIRRFDKTEKEKENGEVEL